jgi:hypothetical protein
MVSPPKFSGITQKETSQKEVSSWTDLGVGGCRRGGIMFLDMTLFLANGNIDLVYVLET